MLPRSFVPESDNSISSLAIELPPGVLLERTAAVSAEAYRIIARHREVADVVESIGEDEDGEVRNASLYIMLVKPEQRSLSQKQWENQLAAELKVIPDARLHFQSQSSGLGRDVTLFVVGSDPAVTERAAQQFVQQLRGLKELRDPRINGDLRRPEIQIRPRGGSRRAARRHGRQHQPDGAHRHAGRYRAEQCQVLAQRSPDTDSREPGRVGAPRSGDDRESAGTDGQRRYRAAQGRRRHRLRPGPLQGAALRPDAPAGGRCRPQWCGIRHGARQDSRPADLQEPAARGEDHRLRRGRVPGRAVHQFLRWRSPPAY